MSKVQWIRARIADRKWPELEIEGAERPEKEEEKEEEEETEAGEKQKGRGRCLLYISHAATLERTRKHA